MQLQAFRCDQPKAIVTPVVEQRVLSFVAIAIYLGSICGDPGANLLRPCLQVQSISKKGLDFSYSGPLTEVR